VKLKGDDYNVVGDVTGYGKTLLKLQEQMPKMPFIGVGDLIDRGPNSKMVLDFFIDQGYYSAMGNHDHMMLYEMIKHDAGVDKRLYPNGCWFWNGGAETVKSFGLDPHLWDVYEIDQKYWDFLRNMPTKIETDNFIITHAPINYKRKDFFNLKEINKNTFLLDASVLWNRNGPHQPSKDGKVMIYGHNSPKAPLMHTPHNPRGIYNNEHVDKAWAMCIDTWRAGYLTGVHLPTLKIYKQEIID